MQRLRHLLTLAALALLPAWAAAAPDARVIVALKPDAPLLRKQALSAADAPAVQAARLQRRADALAAQAGLPLAAGRAIGERQQVLRAPGLTSEALAARLAALPEVEWAVPDRRRRPLLVPGDPRFTAVAMPPGPAAGQWYLKVPDDTIKSAANLQNAWNRRTGSAGMVVAVVDTGVRPDHKDLAGVLLPGIDTIHEAAIANDGDGADADPSDPGDWITALEANDEGGTFYGCSPFDDETGRYVFMPSSWHGTQVATVAAAVSDNVGMAGTAFGVKVLPVRALGKCGGYDSDIIAGMLWAVGLQSVDGRANPVANRAKVINLSLGSPGACEASYVDAVARINAVGAVVVAAAGNDAGLAVGTPANCPGVIGVGGLRHAGTKVGFSDLGPEIALSAPGGNCVFPDWPLAEICLYPILAGSNSGTTTPVSDAAGGSIWTDSYNYSVGTSFAAPIVAGAAALTLLHRPELRPEEVRRVLQVSARDFPQDGASYLPVSNEPVVACLPPSNVEQYQCYCPNDGSLCGAGMLDADAALLASQAGFARIDVVTAAPTAGQSVQLDGSASLAPVGRSVAGYAWVVVDDGGIVSPFTTGAPTEPTIALLPRAAGSFTVRLTVTDDQGGSFFTDETVTVAAASSSSGGGALGWPWLLGLLAAAGALRRPAVPGALRDRG